MKIAQIVAAAVAFALAGAAYGQAPKEQVKSKPQSVKGEQKAAVKGQQKAAVKSRNATVKAGPGGGPAMKGAAKADAAKAKAAVK
jgi:hypothetical protein